MNEKYTYAIELLSSMNKSVGHFQVPTLARYTKLYFRPFKILYKFSSFRSYLVIVFLRRHNMSFHALYSFFRELHLILDKACGVRNEQRITHSFIGQTYDEIC